MEPSFNEWLEKESLQQLIPVLLESGLTSMADFMQLTEEELAENFGAIVKPLALKTKFRKLKSIPLSLSTNFAPPPPVKRTREEGSNLPHTTPYYPRPTEQPFSPNETGPYRVQGRPCTRCHTIVVGSFREHNRLCLPRPSPPCEWCKEVVVGPFSEHNKVCRAKNPRPYSAGLLYRLHNRQCPASNRPILENQPNQMMSRPDEQQQTNVGLYRSSSAEREKRTEYY